MRATSFYGSKLRRPSADNGHLQWLLVFASCITLLSYGGTSAIAADRGDLDFARDVQPILSDKCYFCHGPSAQDRHADLRLDVSPDSQEREPAIVPGNRAASLVWQRINDIDDPMPPTDSHKSLSGKEVEILGRWIDSGAEYEAHWAYMALSRPAPPIVDDSDWSRGEIDRFVYAGMLKHDLKPSAETTPERLLRRLYLDLIGLPPTPDQMEDYLASPTDEAYAKVVEELLASRRFGEHWASWWLDLVRYGDSVGFHGDQPVSVWPYRDWVVDALNANMRFDVFTRMQLAGDQLEADGETEEEKNDRLFASAYNRLGPVTAEGGAQQAEYIAIYAADRVATFGEVWLASSTGCARCHDHKYDPFTMVDFYSLAAVFADIDHPIVSAQNANPHWLPFRFASQNVEQARQIAEVERQYDSLLAKYPEAGPYESWTMSRDAGAAPPHGAWSNELKQLTKQRNELAKSVPVGLITRRRPIPHEVRLLPRGNWMDESGPIMSPAPPQFLSLGNRRANGFSRLDLADWLLDPDHPLTSRVLVNRLWARFLGRGISSNTLDFGAQGNSPTHRELLDWIASEFIDSGWDMQHVMRLIVTSSVYRQSAAQPQHLLEADPLNFWFARQSAPRLTAEVLRDQSLAVSGLLRHRLGGPSVFPYQPDRHWEALNFPKRSYQQSHGDDLYRRSVYTWVQRTFPHPWMAVFDAPSRETCTAARSDSNTPLQSLALLNETLSVESARNLAEAVMLSQTSEAPRIVELFRRVLLRDPSDRELTRMTALLDSQRAYFTSDPLQAKAFCQVGESAADESLPCEELAAYASLARVILNLHETVTKP